MTPNLVISAPPDVIYAWKQAANRALHAANRANDPELVAGLAATHDRDVAELIVYLADTLAHAAVIFLGSVANATPGARDVLDGELKVLVRQVMAEQAGGAPAGDDGCEGGTS